MKILEVYRMKSVCIGILLSLWRLGLLTAVWADQEKKDSLTTEEKILQEAGLSTEGPALLRFFQQRTLSAEERQQVEALIRQLGAPAFRLREQATASLIARGPAIAELLRQAQADPDLEISRRAERCLRAIQERDVSPAVPLAALRLLRQRRPAGAVETLLAFLPFADSENLADEVRQTLAALARGADGQPHKALLAALRDPRPLLRWSAGEALARVAPAAVRPLLQDKEPLVRARAALVLIPMGDRQAVAVLIQTLPELDVNQAWRAEDLLWRLADEQAPVALPTGTDDASRRRRRDAWLAWWQAHQDSVDLNRLRGQPLQRGYTLLVLLDLGKVLEVGPDNKTRWEIDSLRFPLDAQMLPGERVLIAECQGSCLTERNTRGDILWSYTVQTPGGVGPLGAQRLANGNTFLITDSYLAEIDRQGKEVFRYTPPAGERIMKAAKIDNGDIVYLASTLEGRQAARVVRLSASGRERHSFPIFLAQPLFGGRLHALPNGHVLVPHHAENKVVEYDSQGKVVWQVAVERPIAAWRLPNGHTLVTSMSQNRAIEFDRQGREVWQYQANTRVTRAFRR
jgi:hypothetical protein